VNGEKSHSTTSANRKPSEAKSYKEPNFEYPGVVAEASVDADQDWQPGDCRQRGETEDIRNSTKNWISTSLGRFTSPVL